MNLYETCDGILETSVTWTDFEAKLRASLGTDARLGANKAVLDIGEGIGFASRCALITCDWVEAAEDERLPRRVVLKIPSSRPLRQLNDFIPNAQRVFKNEDATWIAMEFSLRQLHNIEVASYDFYEEFEGLTMPTRYYGVMFGPQDRVGGQVCLEFVKNSRMMNFHEAHSVEQLRQIARAIGKIHACSLKKEATAPELHTGFFERFYNTRTKAYSGMFKGIFAVDKSDSTKMLMEKIDSILPDYFDSSLPVTIHKQMGLKPVLVNGDLRTENVMLDNDTGDLSALIDWQCTHLGVGVEDLHRITCFALSAEDRRASTPMLVEEMYNSMMANLDGADAPYSLDTLLLASDLLFPHCAFFFIGAGLALVTNQEKNNNLEDDEKTKRKAVLLDKVIGAFEDILAFDDKNKSKLGNIKFRA